MQNFSCENECDALEKEPVGGTHFTGRLVLMQRQKASEMA